MILPELILSIRLFVVMQTYFLGLWARNYEHVDRPSDVSVLR